MTPALRLRITAFAALAVISFAVNAPSVLSSVHIDRAGPGAGVATGIQDAAAVGNTPADDARVQYAFLDDSVALTAFDASEKYDSHVMGIAHIGAVIGFAAPLGDAALELTSFDSSDPAVQGGTHAGGGGMRSAGSTGVSAGSGASPQQHASLSGGRSPAIAAPQTQSSVPARGGNPGSPLPSGANPAEGGAAPPGDASSPSTPPSAANAASPGHASSPSTPPRAAPVVVADSGGAEGDGLDPYIYGAPPHTEGLISPPVWVPEPTAGESTPGSEPSPGCRTDGTCSAPLPTASNVVPEPGSIALLALGLIGLGLSRRRPTAAARR